MSTDNLYAGGPAEPGSFKFDESVADVFPDMLRRSIPGYAASIQAIGTLAASYVVPGSRCYDLGCSLGAATVAMYRNISAANCRIMAVDTSPAMIQKCRSTIEAETKTDAPKVSIVEADIRDLDISNASMVVMNYTLQFLPPEERAAMIRSIYDGMLPGAILVLSEKVTDEDPQNEELLVNLHLEFKRRNAYSDLEISRKRTALENILIADTEADHKKRLFDAGFEHVGVWLRYFNFISIVAIKQT
ncbi:MAG: tRNA (cmo5U34)-methyltransferase [Woeseiaceae bacterium]|jgi:tRNA (cmo5U34)-methyltransferase